MRKLFLLAALASSLITPAQAEPEGLQWTQGNDKTTSIYYAEPESDNIWFSASCTRRGVVQLMFTIEQKFVSKVGPHSKQYYAEVFVGTDRYRLIGQMEENDMNNTHDLIVFQTPDNPLLQRLARDDKAKFKFGQAVIGLDKKSLAGFQRVLKKCD